jgi:hypothetical protein
MTDEVFTAVDREALERAVALTLANDPPEQGRVDQVRDFLAEREWEDVATFCAYHQQAHRLKLPPWAWPPCWVEDVAETLARGRDDVEYPAAVLAKKLLNAGLSIYEPDPAGALRAKRKQKV